jgi:DNA-binding transcriptional LysR family regulator
LKDGSLVEVLAPFAHNAINLYAVYPTRAHLPLRVRVFIDFVIATINGSLPHPHVRDGSKSSRRGR